MFNDIANIEKGEGRIWRKALKKIANDKQYHLSLSS